MAEKLRGTFVTISVQYDIKVNPYILKLQLSHYYWCLLVGLGLMVVDCAVRGSLFVSSLAPRVGSQAKRRRRWVIPQLKVLDSLRSYTEDPSVRQGMIHSTFARPQGMTLELHVYVRYTCKHTILLAISFLFNPLK